MNNPRLLLYPIGYILTNEEKLVRMPRSDRESFECLYRRECSICIVNE